MLVKTSTIAIRGIEPIVVDVEVSIYNRGLPAFNIIGLPDKAVDESRFRIKSVFQNLKLDFPDKKITDTLLTAGSDKKIGLRHAMQRGKRSKQCFIYIL